MKTYAVHQEILLIVNTVFFSGPQRCKKNDAADGGKMFEKQNLEEACWNGFINAMLPEILESNDDGENLLLWEIHQGNCFLDLELGDYPVSFQKEFSVNPYIFMESQLFN